MRLAFLTALILCAGTASAQDAPRLDPLILRMDPLAFEEQGVCYLAAFNAANGSSFAAEPLFRTLAALPAAHPDRATINYDVLVSAADLAIGQTCDTVTSPPADPRLAEVFTSGMSACALQGEISRELVAELLNILAATSDAALQVARVDRGGLQVQLQQIARTDCTADATPTPTPNPDPTPVPTPSPAPTPTPEVATFDWRDLPQGEEMTRYTNFDIPLADLLIEGRYIALFSEGTDVRDATGIAILLDLPAAAVIDVMPRMGAAVLAVPPADLERIATHNSVAGFTQDRYGFFNEARPANNAAQDLVDQITGGLNDQFNPLTETRQVRVYVVDGGIRANHDEVAQKVSHWRAIGDHHGGLLRHVCERHGTAVASLIAGETLGIAGNVDLIDVDITPCDGQDPTAFPASHILIALDWISQTQSFLPGRNVPTLVNLSLGVPAGDADAFVKQGAGFYDPGLFGLDAFETKMQQFLNRHPNVTLVAAAGNEGANACHYFPARMADVVTVGGTTLNDTLWGNSNFGACVDTFALAEQVAVADADLGTDGMSLVNGTSFSTAIVTGVIAHRLAAGQSIEAIRRDILRPTTLDRTLGADLARSAVPEDGALAGSLQFLAKIPSPFRADCEVNSYDGTLNMRSGPGTGNTVLRQLRNGDGLSLQGRSGDKWLLVRLRDGQQGWVARSDRRATLVRNLGTGTDCEQ